MSTTQIDLVNVRLSFPNLFTPRPPEKPGDKPRYDALFILEKGSKNDEQVRAAIQEVVQSKWDGKIVPEALAKMGYHDGIKKSQYDGFDENVMYISASSQVRPSIVDRNGSPLVQEDGKLYPGVRVVAYLNVTAMDTKGYGKQCNFYIRGVQFYKDDEALGAGKPMDISEFKTFDDEVEDEAMFG